MRRALAFVAPALRDARPRMLGLMAFGLVFLLSATGAAAFFKGPHGQVAMGEMMVVGGYPMTAALLLLGWLIGRFPLIAILVLTAGLFSRDRAEGYARLFYARPVRPLALYGLRLLALAVVAFALSAVLLPCFDLIMLGTWAGPATFVLIGANIVVYGSLNALLSVWTRADAWITLFLAVVALAWHALLRGVPHLGVPAGPRTVVTALLPPQGALFALENAFGSLHPIPWGAVGHACAWGAIMLLLAGASLRFREV